MGAGLNFDARYRVEGYRGIAFYVRGYVKQRDEDSDWSGIETVDTSRVEVVMVGDDRVHIVDTSDLTELKEDEYCPECGQIGCTAYAGVYSDV